MKIFSRRLLWLGGLITVSVGFAPLLGAYPRNWGGGGLGFELNRDTTIKHTGESSGSLKATAKAGRFGTFTQWFAAEQYRGKRLKLSGSIRTDKVGADGTDGRVGLWMRVDGKTKTALAFDNMANQKLDGTTDWKDYAIVLDIPNDAEAIFFGCLLIGSGQAWVDDMKFSVVGNDVAPTGPVMTPMDRAKDETLPTDLPKEPRNLDFES